MTNYTADSDIASIIGESGLRVPDDLEPGEQERVRNFLRLMQVREDYWRQGGQAPASDLAAAAAAAQDLYEKASDRLPVGFQKLAVLQGGFIGIELDSAAIMEWAYWACKDNPGWLGNFDDDIDRGMPLREMTQAIPPMTMMNFQRRVA